MIEKTVLAIENCYSGGEIQGDINLSALDCGKIVNEVFAEVYQQYPSNFLFRVTLS